MYHLRKLSILCFGLVMLLSLTAPTHAGEVQLHPMEANKAGILVQSFLEQQDATMVFIYASWCPVCRKNFPLMIDLAREYKNKGLNVVALSLDRDPNALKRYLAAVPGELPFTPYWINQRYSNEFAVALNRVGINYRNGIPYTVLYGRGGRVIGQGNIQVSSLGPVVKRLVSTVY